MTHPYPGPRGPYDPRPPLKPQPQPQPNPPWINDPRPQPKPQPRGPIYPK